MASMRPALSFLPREAQQKKKPISAKMTTQPTATPTTPAVPIPPEEEEEEDRLLEDRPVSVGENVGMSRVGAAVGVALLGAAEGAAVARRVATRLGLRVDACLPVPREPLPGGPGGSVGGETTVNMLVVGTAVGAGEGPAGGVPQKQPLPQVWKKPH